MGVGCGVGSKVGWGVGSRVGCGVAVNAVNVSIGCGTVVATGSTEVHRVGSVAGRVLDPVESVVPTVSMLARDRLNRLDALVARNPDTIERDSGRQPARRGELLVIDPSPVHEYRSEELPPDVT